MFLAECGGTATTWSSSMMTFKPLPRRSSGAVSSVKLFEEEEDLGVYLLLDGSRSMDWGEGELHKFRYALKLCAGLGAIALGSGDAVSVALLKDGAVASSFGPLRGQASLPRLFGLLEGLQPGGTTE